MKAVLFGAEWCGFCKTEKQWLDSKNIQYEYVDIEKNEDGKNYLEIVVNSLSVPVTIVQNDDDIKFDGILVRGFDRKRLSQLLKI